MQAISFSKQGYKSEKNEDASLALVAKQLFVVADGVGGGPSGDFASRTLIDEIYAFASSKHSLSESLLLEAIKSANTKIFDAAQSPELSGMATTLALVWFEPDIATVMHVGDSRVYRVGEQALEPLTSDHSKLIKKSNDVEKYVVTNAVGIRKELKIDIKQFARKLGDSFLLVTDGITDVLDDETLQGYVGREGVSLSERINLIISACEQCGGRDDKTIIYVYG